jgi:hypothetical protein
MAKEREPKFYVAVAEKGAGKTYYMINMLIPAYIRGSKGIPGKKVLVVDINNEYPFRTIPASEQMVRLFNKQPVVEARKVSVFKQDGDRKTPDELKQDLAIILKYFRGGMIVIEDINKIMSDNVSAEIFGYLCVNRHADQDLIINLQNIGKAGHPKIKATMNILRMHHVKEDVRRHEGKFEEYVHILRIAQLVVNTRYDAGIKKIRELEDKGKFKGNKDFDYWDVNFCKFYLYVDFDRNQIYGNFTKDEFINAATEYIYENDKFTIQTMLKRRDKVTGKPIYNYKTAFDKALETIMMQYYGNPK